MFPWKILLQRTSSTILAFVRFLCDVIITALISLERPDSAPLTFERRIEKIKNTQVITKFVEKYKTGRSEIQIWANHIFPKITSCDDDQKPSTSRNNIQTARHHVIPGDTLRDAFLHMLSNQTTWPYMVQMLNAALENLRHHISSTEIEWKFIDEAQDALDMLDARIKKCDFDFDSKSFEKALEYLFALFYWSPFNICYGPLPHTRAPADVGNKRDKDPFPGILSAESLQELEGQFKNFDISESTVKKYILHLFLNQTPDVAGPCKKILLTFDDYTKKMLTENMKKPRPDEIINRMVSVIKKDIIYTDGISLFSDLKYAWMHQLKGGGACERCITYAKDSLIKEVPNYRCISKKCPIFHSQSKYPVGSYVNEYSIKKNNVRSQIAQEYLSETKLHLGNIIWFCENMTRIMCRNLPFEYTMTKFDNAITFIFKILTDNFDREYKRLKEIKMSNRPVTVAELYGPHMPLGLRRGPDNTENKIVLSIAFKLTTLPREKRERPFWHPD